MFSFLYSLLAVNVGDVYQTIAVVLMVIDILSALFMTVSTIKSGKISLKGFLQKLFPKLKDNKTVKDFCDDLKETVKEVDKMAKFTMLYGEYINDGGEVPHAFSLIPDYNGVSFEDLFLLHYCEREIGFETEELFKIKLEAKANIICPFYAKKINDFNDLQLLKKEKKIKKRYGEAEEKQKIYADAIPNESGEFSSDSVVSGTNTKQEEREDLETETENLSAAEWKEYNESVKNIYALLLEEFKTLFAVYYR